MAKNFYVWDSNDAAEGFFSPELTERVTGLYGVAPTIDFLEIAQVVDYTSCLREKIHVSVTYMKMERKRPYRMVARAESAVRTGERIIDAAVEMFFEEPARVIPLDELADRAGVTVQTVIRRFGGREGLMAAAAERETGRVREERDVAPGDVEGAVRVLIEHYERNGDRVLRMLAEESRSMALRKIVEGGRRLHRDWCASVFAPALTGLSAAGRARRLAQLVAVCDVYTWMLLRRQSGLSRNQTTLALRELLTPLTEPTE